MRLSGFSFGELAQKLDRPAKMKNNLSIREASSYLGVSPITLRRWEKQGRLTPSRTKGNQRRYALSQLQFLKSLSRKGNSQSNSESNEALLLTLLSKMDSVEAKLETVSPAVPPKPL